MNNNSSYHVLLASYTWGKDANRHNGMSNQALIDECLRDIAKIHKRNLDYVKDQVFEAFLEQRPSL